MSREPIVDFFSKLAPGGALANYPWSRLRPRTIPVAHEDVIYAADYGGSWDGTGDDTSALMDCMAAARAKGNGATVMLPKRVRTTETIDVRSGIALVGWGNWINSGIHHGTLIDWAGASDGTIVQCWGRDITIEDVSVKCASGYSANRAFDVTWPPDTYLCTSCTFRNLFIRMQRITYGMVFGDTTQGFGSYPANCDYMRFDSVYVDDGDEDAVAGIYVPNTSGQAKQYVFYGGSLGFVQYGLYAQRVGMKFIGTGFTGCTKSAVHSVNSSEPHEFIACDSEACTRLYESLGNSGASQIVLFSGGRFDVTTAGKLHEDGRYISIGHTGPIVCSGTLFAAPDDSNWCIHDTGASSPMQVFTAGCLFPSNASGYEALVSGHNARWSRAACKVAPLSGEHFVIPDRSYELNVAGWANLPAFAEGSEPSSAAAGALIRNSTTNRPRYYDGSAWDDVVLTGDLP